MRRTRPLSGSQVSRLRARFGMSRAQFARLLGVSAPTISNWESRDGALKPHDRTLKAWQAVARLGKREAWARLGD